MVEAQFRLSYRECRALLAAGLAEPAPGRIQLLAGPRQVGKTTLLLDLAAELGPAGLYAACDGPEASLPGFWERLWHRAEATGAAHGRAVVLLDEGPTSSRTGRRGSRASGTACAVGTSPCTWSPRAPRPSGSRRARGKAWPGGSSG